MERLKRRESERERGMKIGRALREGKKIRGEGCKNEEGEG